MNEFSLNQVSATGTIEDDVQASTERMLACIPEIEGSSPSWSQRCIEIAFALLALTAGLPVMLLIALIIRLDSPGPVLFFQQRVGQGGKLFTFVKFRTLYADARERFPELYAYQYTGDDLDDLKFKQDEDPRVTRQGQWLRRTSLDELPNFWNVLTGEMALVGPRPEIPEMMKYYNGDMLMKFSVRPGVTGPAQISGRGRLKFYDTVDFDVDYVRERYVHRRWGGSAWWLDLKLVLTTIKKVVVQDGAF